MLKKNKGRILLYTLRIKKARIKKVFFIALFFCLTSAYLLQENFLFLIYVKNNSLEPDFPQYSWLLFKNITSSKKPPDHPSTVKRGDLIAYYHFREKNRLKSILRFPVFVLSLGLVKWGSPPLAVRRVIGLPGDKIKISNKSIYLNGELYLPDWSFKYEDSRIIPREISQRDHLNEVIIPNDQVFVISHFWDSLSDSRNRGTIMTDQIKGRFWKVIQRGQ